MATAPGKLNTFIVSDVHLNTQPYDAEAEPENPNRRHFREFITQLIRLHKPGERTILVLNGDILDITGSWFDAPLPWDNHTDRVQKILLKILEQIASNNAHVFAEMRHFLSLAGTEIHYIFGNHDRLLGLYPIAQQFLRDVIGGPDAGGSVALYFKTELLIPELNLYAEHGQRFDPFNFEHDPTTPPFGEIINILIINRFLGNVLKALREAGYSEAVVEDVKQVLDDLEYLRPLSLGPYWLQNVLHRYDKHPENKGKPASIGEVITRTAMALAFDRKLTHIVAKRLRIPRPILINVLRFFLRFPGLLPVLSYIVTRLQYRTHYNRYQQKMARQINASRGYHLLVFGHTHIPELLALNERTYYFNTGCWKPVIHLFKPPKGQPPLLEYLFSETPFNKIQRCGIFKAEKDLTRPELPARFEIATMQQGVG